MTLQGIDDMIHPGPYQLKEWTVDQFIDYVLSWRPPPIDRVGIRINLSEIPEYTAYAALRDRLAGMNKARRWLSFRKRRECKRLYRQAQQAFLNAVLELGQEGQQEST